jgi:hypothetical protein
MHNQTDGTIVPLSEKDLRDAQAFRAGVHKEALAIIQKTFPEIGSVVDRYPAESYFQAIWDYPGQWYIIVAIPKESGSREALIETIVRDTLDRHRRQKNKSAEEKPCSF